VLSFFASLVGGTLKDWLAGRQRIAEAKATARVEAVRNGIPGYSDEFLVLVWAYPFIAQFVPQLADSAAAGLQAAAALPDWYIGGFISISFAVFGIDKLFRWRSGK
jgi:hypothetical protein